MANYDKHDKIVSLDREFDVIRNRVMSLRSDVSTFYNNNHIDASKTRVFSTKLDKVVELVLDAESVYKKQVRETRQLIQEVVNLNKLGQSI